MRNVDTAVAKRKCSIAITSRVLQSLSHRPNALDNRFPIAMRCIFPRLNCPSHSLAKCNLIAFGVFIESFRAIYLYRLRFIVPFNAFSISGSVLCFVHFTLFVWENFVIKSRSDDSSGGENKGRMVLRTEKQCACVCGSSTL